MKRSCAGEVRNVSLLVAIGTTREGYREILGITELSRQSLSKAADLLEESGHETLTFYALPDSHRIKLRTNNPLARIMREIRRRTRVAGAFPDGRTCLNPSAAKPVRLRGRPGPFFSETSGSSVADQDAVSASPAAT